MSHGHQVRDGIIPIYVASNFKTIFYVFFETALRKVVHKYYLHAILYAAFTFLAAAVVAYTLDDQAMSADSKSMLAGDGVSQLQQLIALEFDQLVTFRAIEMIMLWIAIIMFVHATAIEFKFAKKARFDKLVKRTIDGWATDVIVLSFAGQLVDQLIGIKMFMMLEDLFDQIATLVCIAQAATLQVLFEALLGGQRDFDSSQRWFFARAHSISVSIGCRLNWLAIFKGWLIVLAGRAINYGLMGCGIFLILERCQPSPTKIGVKIPPICCEKW